MYLYILMIYATQVYSILLKFSCAGRARVNFNSQLEKIFVVTLKKKYIWGQISM